MSTPKKSIYAKAMEYAKSTKDKASGSSTGKKLMGAAGTAMSVGGKALGMAGTGAAIAFTVPMVLDLLEELGVEIGGGKAKERRQLADDMSFQAKQGMFDTEDESFEQLIVPMGIRQDQANQRNQRMVQGPDMGRMGASIQTEVDSLTRGREQQLMQQAVPMDQRPSLLEIAARMGAI